MKKKTHDDYVYQVNAIAPNIEVVGVYNGCTTKILHKCKVCGYEWNVKPNSILNGRGCPECAKYNRAINNTKTHKQYVEEVYSINPNIEVIGKYVGADEKIEVSCKICGNKWSARAAGMLRGCGCPKCAKVLKTKTHAQYISELHDVNPDIAVIEKYVNSYTKIKHLCLKCGYEWEAAPNSLLHGNHCPKCSRGKSHEEYVAELAIKNPNIEVIGKYINANINTVHRCKICGHEWMVRPSHILHGLGCPSCKETSGEQMIKRWLIDNCINYETQKRFEKCKNKRMLPFDFYLPDYNICIEYDGAQHFIEVEHWGGKKYLLQRQQNDKIKNVYCEKYGIYLIRIRYDENVYMVLNNKLKPMIFDNNRVG